jgi:CDP-diacylglycerol--serine O-phosphatidyltransferase
MALKFKNVTLKDNLPKYLIVAVALIAAIIFHWLAVPVVFIAYIILSLAFKNKTS